MAAALLASLWMGAMGCEPPDEQGEPVDCGPYAFEEGGNEWTVEFVNNRAEPVYVEVGCDGLPFRLSDSEGNDVVVSGFGCECFCDELALPGLASCFDCATDCVDFSSVRRIDPGATWMVEAAGIVLEEAPEPIPSDCVDQPQEVDYPCVLRRQAQPGSYSAQATISAALACEGAGCDCTPDDDGTCTTMGALADGVTVDTTLTFPGTATFTFD